MKKGRKAEKKRSEKCRRKMLRIEKGKLER